MRTTGGSDALVDLADVLVLAEYILNHPGHADQKSHGRKKAGGSGEVRDALAGAESINEINAAAMAEAKRITGRHIAFDMTGSDPQTAREHAEGVLRGLERFPNAKLTFVSVAHLAPNTWAQADVFGGITFNSAFASPAGRKRYLASLREGEAGWDKGLEVYGVSDLKMSSFHTRNSGTPTATALHEFGHIVDMATTSRRSHPAVDNLLQTATAREQRSQTVPGAKIRNPADLVMRTVSKYAMENQTELVAEAFTDVMVNGSAASEVSKGIFDILEREYGA